MAETTLSRTATVCFRGLEVTPVDVQVQLAAGLPSFALVGLPDKAVAESKERVRAALYALGLAFPAKRITVNLAPADLQKEGTHYDLPIALALLTSLGALQQGCVESFVALGELSLDGHILKTLGGLSAALYAKSVDKGLMCAEESGAEAAWVGGLNVLCAKHLLQFMNHFKGSQVLSPPTPVMQENKPPLRDMKSISGQKIAKRALEVSAAGGHNLLMIGPPGAGKTLLSETFPSILPPLTPEESLEVTSIHSLAGTLKNGQLMRARPFRNPHHSASPAAMLGGGLKGKPGEVSLAHRGVLFLDELPEFSRTLLEGLRQPLESGEAVVARANIHVTYPAHIQLIGAMNPCACGYLGFPDLQCGKAPVCAEKYQDRLSGPFLDRMDVRIYISAPSTFDNTEDSEEDSESVRKRVERAREFQRERLAAKYVPPNYLNAHLPFNQLEPFLILDSQTTTLLHKATQRWHFSTRGVHRTLRLARTIADLAGSEALRKAHVAEALRYRPLRMRLQKAA